MRGELTKIGRGDVIAQFIGKQVKEHRVTLLADHTGLIEELGKPPEKQHGLCIGNPTTTGEKLAEVGIPQRHRHGKVPDNGQRQTDAHGQEHVHICAG